MMRRNPFRRVLAAAEGARSSRRVAKICARLRSEAGGALVELAVYLSLIGLPLLFSVDYYGTLIIDQIDIDNAAYSGAMYAMTGSTYAEDTSNIQAAAEEDSSIFGSNLTVTPSVFYACSLSLTGTQYTTQAAATTACTGGVNHALELVKVTASGSATPALTVPGLSRSKTLSSTVIMEVEE